MDIRRSVTKREATEEGLRRWRRSGRNTKKDESRAIELKPSNDRRGLKFPHYGLQSVLNLASSDGSDVDVCGAKHPRSRHLSVAQVFPPGPGSGAPEPNVTWIAAQAGRGVVYPRKAQRWSSRTRFPRCGPRTQLCPRLSSSPISPSPTRSPLPLLSSPLGGWQLPRPRLWASLLPLRACASKVQREARAPDSPSLETGEPRECSTFWSLCRPGIRSRPVAK